MEQVADELRCPICLELFECPVILPCSHILCHSPCAERLFTHGFVRCPVCRDTSFVSGGLPSLPRVISLENIIQTYLAATTAAAITTTTVEDGDEEDETRPADNATASVAEAVESGATIAEAVAADDVEPPGRSQVADADDVGFACEMCAGDTPRAAYRTCIDCSVSYCSVCLRLSHPNKLPFSSHRLEHPAKRQQNVADKCCPHHNVPVNIYCSDCQSLGCLLCADDQDAHPLHTILSLTQAVQYFTEILEDGLQKLQTVNVHRNSAIQAKTESLAQFQTKVEHRRGHINEQFDDLIRELESKRQFFLSDLEYEQTTKTARMQRDLAERQDNATQQTGLVHCVQQVLRHDNRQEAVTNDAAFIQLAQKADEKMRKHITMTTEQELDGPNTTLNHKVIDVRKEKAILRDMTYLNPPSTPVINVTKCSRAENSVVIVLSPPTLEYDVIDGYRLYYCSRLQKAQGHQETLDFKTPKEERVLSRGPPSGHAVCFVHDNLEKETEYFFCVRAYNMAGESDVSEIINCMTSTEHSRVTVPQITEGLCRTYTHSIQIYSSSVIEEHHGMSHYLLYRESSAMNKLWKSISMYGRLDHRVFGLEFDTLYDLVVLACNATGECLISATVTLRTETAAY